MPIRESDDVKEIVVHTEWRAIHYVEVPADFEWDGNDLGALLDAMAAIDLNADLSASNGELTDWGNGA
jgi:hypothetical protein